MKARQFKEKDKEKVNLQASKTEIEELVEKNKFKMDKADIRAREEDIHLNSVLERNQQNSSC
jgi:hypothetical protein